MEVLAGVNAYCEKWGAQKVEVLAEGRHGPESRSDEVMLGKFDLIYGPGAVLRYEPRWAVSVVTLPDADGEPLRLLRFRPLRVSEKGHVALGEEKDERPSPISWESAPGRSVFYVSPDADLVRRAAFPD